MAETSTTAVWVERVDAWRASGERAEVFSRRAGYAANTLRWWASKLKRELGASDLPPPPQAEVRIARVVRASVVEVPAAKPIVIEVVHAGVRISVDAGTDRAALAMVLEVLGVGGAR